MTQGCLDQKKDLTVEEKPYTSFDGQKFKTWEEREIYLKTHYRGFWSGGEDSGDGGGGLSGDDLKVVGRVTIRLLIPALIYWLCVYPAMTASWLLENSSFGIFRLLGKMFYFLWLSFIKVVGFPIWFLNDTISVIIASVVWFMVLIAITNWIQIKHKKFAKALLKSLFIAAVIPVLLMILVSILGGAGQAADMKVYGYDPYSWGILRFNGGYTSIMAPPFLR